MRIILILYTFCFTSNLIVGQTVFDGDIHQVDIDIMELNNSCFQDFTKEEVEILLVFDRALKRYKLSNTYKMIGVFRGQESLGLYMLIDKKHYQILPATIETYSDLSSKRFLLMRGHKYGNPQLIQHDENLKNGVAFDFFKDHFRISQYRNSLPVGEQLELDLINDKLIVRNARIVPIINNHPMPYSDTIEVINRNINKYEGFIVERSDSTSVIEQYPRP